MLRTYQAMVIFPATLPEETLNKAIETVKGELARAGGVILEENRMGRRSFARVMKKSNDGVYICFKVDLPPEKIDGLSARLRLNADIFRFQITSHIEVEPSAVPVTAEGPDGQP